MEIEKQNKVKNYISSEILNLNLKRGIIKNASKKFNISKDDATMLFNEIRHEIKNTAIKRAFTYLLLGSISFSVGLYGTISKTGYIFYGAILIGTGMLITSLGLFRTALLKRKV